MENIDKLEGHLVLYCKSHYSIVDVDFLLGLRRIWAIRCGLENRFVENKAADRYIADSLYEIIQKIRPNKIPTMHESIHESLDYISPWYKDLNSLELLIMTYRNIIMSTQIKEKRGDRYFTLVKLPKPKSKVFTRIISGKGKYNDYKLIN